MADPGDKKKRATYQDVLDAPEHMVAEIVDGELYLSPRPAGPHTRVGSKLGYELGPPFDDGNGGPGGWIILDEPEIHLGASIVVPDLAGWRRERLPHVWSGAFTKLAPDWICEVLSKRTERFDRTKKMRVYARAGVQYAWLVKPVVETLEVYRLIEGRWSEPAAYVGNVTARVQPFDAIELALSRLWRDLPPPPPPRRASEGGPPIYEYEFERDIVEL